MDRIHRISQFGTRVGCTATPWRKRDRNGTFSAQRTMTSPWYYTEADALRFSGAAAAAPQGAVAVYGRVFRRE